MGQGARGERGASAEVCWELRVVWVCCVLCAVGVWRERGRERGDSVKRRRGEVRLDNERKEEVEGG